MKITAVVGKFYTFFTAQAQNTFRCKTVVKEFKDIILKDIIKRYNYISAYDQIHFTPIFIIIKFGFIRANNFYGFLVRISFALCINNSCRRFTCLFNI
jgi:hypothetical protein